jgi:hypothetical protein
MEKLPMGRHADIERKVEEAKKALKNCDREAVKGS